MRTQGTPVESTVKLHANTGAEFEDRIAAGASFSGSERNCLFMNQGGRAFADLSPLSGLDDPADGQRFVIWDPDRDGWLDFAVVNNNTPALQLFRNGLARTQGKANLVAVQLVGGNRTAAASAEWSARDGVGAVVTATAGDLALLREHRAGDGYGVQNSRTVFLGLGRAREARELTVRWPSGKVQTAGSVREGSLVTFYEDAQSSPGGTGFTVGPYRSEPRAVAASARPAVAEPAAGDRLSLAPSSARLTLHQTLASWCTACRTHYPQLLNLKESFSDSELAMLGVPVDAEDDPVKLAAYAAEHSAGYRTLLDISASKREEVIELVRRRLHGESIPATIVTSSDGRVVHMQWGAPSVSRIRELLAQERTLAVSDRGAP